MLKPFQVGAVEELKREVLHRWGRDTQQDIKFQSPTGSGKTVMMAQFVRDLVKGTRACRCGFCVFVGEYWWVTGGGFGSAESGEV